MNTIHCRDCVEGMMDLDAESVHLVLTSPPYYNAMEYTQFRTYEDFLSFIQIVTREIHRILKPGRFFAINTSPIIEAREKRQDQSTRYPIPFDIHPRIMRSGFMFIEDIVWIKPEPSVKNRNAGFYRHRKPLAYKPNSVTEYIMIYRKRTDKLIDWNLNQYDDETINRSLIRGNYERSNAWHINPESCEDHPAIFPEELSDRIIQYYSFKDDVVLDPFMGSGTTAVSCKKLGRKWIGFERSEEFCNFARKRVMEYKVFKKMDEFFRNV